MLGLKKCVPIPCSQHFFFLKIKGIRSNANIINNNNYHHQKKKWVYIQGIEEKHFTDIKILDFLLITPRSRFYQLSNINEVILSERLSNFPVQHVIRKTRSETGLHCRANASLARQPSSTASFFPNCSPKLKGLP